MKKMLLMLVTIVMACSGVQAQVRKCACHRKEVCRMSYCREKIHCYEPAFTPDPRVNSNGEDYVYCSGAHCGGCGCHHSLRCGKEGRAFKEPPVEPMIMHYKPEVMKYYKVCKDEDGHLTCCRF